MASKHSVAMFVQGEDGSRVQVGWASPKDESGVRTFEYSPGYENTRPKDVSFEDDELTQLVAEEQHDARLGDGSDGEDFEVQVEEQVATVEPEAPLAAAPVEDAPDVNKAADPVEDAPHAEEAAEPIEADVNELEEPVELDADGDVADTADEDEEAEFQRLLAEEEAEKKEQPQTRRELRENEDGN